MCYGSNCLTAHKSIKIFFFEKKYSTFFFAHFAHTCYMYWGKNAPNILELCIGYSRDLLRFFSRSAAMKKTRVIFSGLRIFCLFVPECFFLLFEKWIPICDGWIYNQIIRFFMCVLQFFSCSKPNFQKFSLSRALTIFRWFDRSLIRHHMNRVHSGLQLCSYFFVFSFISFCSSFGLHIVDFDIFIFSIVHVSIFFFFHIVCMPYCMLLLVCRFYGHFSWM